MKPIPNTLGQENAYTIDDYPYGFTLRCKMRYWVEFRKGKGFRLVTQTSNPKRIGEHWNTPKKGTYHRVTLGMYLNEIGHVICPGMSECSNYSEAVAFKEKFYPCLSDVAKQSLDEWIEIKRVYETEGAKSPAMLKLIQECSVMF